MGWWLAESRWSHVRLWDRWSISSACSASESGPSSPFPLPCSPRAAFCLGHELSLVAVSGCSWGLAVCPSHQGFSHGTRHSGRPPGSSPGVTPPPADFPPSLLRPSASQTQRHHLVTVMGAQLQLVSAVLTRGAACGLVCQLLNLLLTKLPGVMEACDHLRGKLIMVRALHGKARYSRAAGRY